MKSLILTVLYLARDTVNRWFSRISSPVARVLVVFFLTLCALCFLGTYVISVKAIVDRIRQQGGDIVRLDINGNNDDPCPLPTWKEVDRLLEAESLGLSYIGSASLGTEGLTAAVGTYDFSRMPQWQRYESRSGVPTLLVGESSCFSPGLINVKVSGQPVDVLVRRVHDGSLCAHLVRHDYLLLLPPESELISLVKQRSPSGTQTLLLRLHDQMNLQGMRRAVAFCENYLRLEKRNGRVLSAKPLLEELDVILKHQMQCRAIFCLGMCGIVGILLTALSSMEYRQNEYIYTLMKSFGIHPLLLVGAFIVENLLLVGASFGAAVGVFMYAQHYIVSEFFKVGHYSLQLAEIMPELQLVALSLLGCVLVSCVPIMLAAHRDIGRVLK